MPSASLSDTNLMGLRKCAVVVLGACLINLVSAGVAGAYEWPKSLQEGAKGKDVRALQTRVAGWFRAEGREFFALDGIFSDQTKAALAAFQEHYGMNPDGVAGSATFKALDALEDEDGSTAHFDYSEFWQNRNSSCSKAANRYAGSFAGGKVPEAQVIRNVRRLMWRLEALRAKLGDKPIAINSGFRSVAYNRCINGASYSQHMYGTAADLRVVEVSNRAGRDQAKRSQVHGIGCYSSLSHNHLDLRMHNTELEATRYWWWPERDKKGRDLADDHLPCYGEIARNGSVSAAGAAIESASLDMRTWSADELDRWKRAGEESDLLGLD
jgi:zinc D-Ala-D-Ala carboxypeptidase